MAESQDYYRGKADGIRALTWSRCKQCGNGWDVEKREDGWYHIVQNDEAVRCQCQVEQNHIHRAEQEARRAYLTGRYGSMWHTSYRKKTGFLDFDKQCYCCDARSTQRIDVNCWGVVAEYDVCDEHAERYDGENCDEVISREEADRMAANSRA